MVERTVEIVGAGAGLTLLEGASVQRVVHVTPSGSLTLQGVTIRHGRASQGGGVLVEGALELFDSVVTKNYASSDAGGGIFVAAGGSATITRSHTWSNVAADEGGGIAVEEGDLIVLESTLDGNRSGIEGGGALWIDGTAQVLSSTISGNRGGLGAGGAQLAEGTLSIANVTITRNRGGPVDGVLQEAGDLTLFASILDDNSAVDCGGTIRSLGYNVFEHTGSCVSGSTLEDLLGVDARLSSLGDHGGPTPTHRPAVSSAAIDLAPIWLCSPLDQRGAPRMGGCDAGSMDVAVCLDRHVTLAGSPSDDLLVGTSDTDVIRAYEGNDIIQGAAGNDVICADQGDDRVAGGAGRDEIYGGDGSDRIRGGGGGDALSGGPGDDRLSGGGDRDHGSGGPGDDFLSGAGGRDWLNGQQGHDILFGGRNGDRIRGGPGNDRLDGGKGSDDCHAGKGWNDHRVNCEARDPTGNKRRRQR